MYTKIMVPLDGSNLAESALALAFALGRKTGASLHFVMVIERLSSIFGLGRVEYRGDWGHEYLGNLVDAAASEGSKKSTYSLNTGNVVDELEKEQEEFQEQMEVEQMDFMENITNLERTINGFAKYQQIKQHAQVT